MDPTTHRTMSERSTSELHPVPSVKEGNCLFNDALNTFYLRLYDVRHMVKDHSDSERGRKEGNVLFNDVLNTFFYLRLYGVRHMVKDHSDREKGNPLLHMGYSFQLTVRVLLYEASQTKQDNFSLLYISRVELQTDTPIKQQHINMS